MGFENLNTDASVAVLNGFLADKSYVEGFCPSQADVAVFEALNASLLNASKYAHAARWYKHISSMKASFSSYKRRVDYCCMHY